MLTTPVTDASKIGNTALKISLTNIKQVQLSKDVVDWLCKVTYKQVYVVGLAVDFYFSTYIRDVFSKKISGEDGFDPCTGYDYYIVNDVNYNAWIGSLQAYVDKSIAWQDSFMFTYLCAAVAGELRHCPVSVDKALKQKLFKFGVLNDSYQNDLIRAATQERFLKTITMSTIKEFLETAVAVFTCGKWSGGYGGPKWGEIASTGLARFNNEVTQSQFIDRVYDLKHNGGPMFDKNKAVINSGLQSFLNAKFAAKSDYDWYSWIQKYASRTLIDFVCRAKKLNFWSGPTPQYNEFQSIVGDDEASPMIDESSNDENDNNEVDDLVDALIDKTTEITSSADKNKLTMPSLNCESKVCANGHASVIEALTVSVPEKA